MLTLEQLYILLADNEQLLVVERRLYRQVELLAHRANIKDCIIQLLEAKVLELEQPKRRLKAA